VTCATEIQFDCTAMLFLSYLLYWKRKVARWTLTNSY